MIVVACSVAAVAPVGIVALLVVGGRDEGSYQYSRTTISFEAQPWWIAVNNVGIEKSNLRTVEDACTSIVNADMDQDSPQADSMKRMDREDIIAGCTSVLEEEQKSGDLP